VPIGCAFKIRVNVLLWGLFLARRKGGHVGARGTRCLSVCVSLCLSVSVCVCLSCLCLPVSLCHSVTLQSFTLSLCHSFQSVLFQSVTLSLRVGHYVTLSLCHSVTLSQHRTTNAKPSQAPRALRRTATCRRRLSPPRTKLRRR
jgi:hypothetical protein